MLYFTRPWSLTNPLDEVYGLLSLTDPSLPKSLVVDYSKSIMEASMETARWYLEHGVDLFILNLASSLKFKDRHWVTFLDTTFWTTWIALVYWSDLAKIPYWYRQKATLKIRHYD
jgi:hypothetical protein